MKLLSRIFIVGIIIVILLAAVSFVFPRQYLVERSIEIHAPAAVVFTHVGDLRAWPKWTIWAEMDPAMKTVYSKKTVGVGATSSWDGPKAGKGRMEVTAFEPDRRIAYNLYFDGFDMASVGEITLSEFEGVTTVSWSDAGDLGMNPLHRWFGLAIDKMIGPDFEAGLARLKALCEEPDLLGDATKRAGSAAAAVPAPARPTTAP